VINDGRELFGTATQVDGQAASDGFAALRALDSNGDGRLTAADTAFGELKIWQDANGDGLTEQGELSTLADHGITALNLSAQASTATDNGNLLGLVSSYETADGAAHEMVDVWFQQGDVLRDSVTGLTQSLGSYLEADGGGADAVGDALTQLPGTTGTQATGATTTLAVQLDAYYQQQALGVNPLAQSVSVIGSLLSGTGSGTTTTLLASADGSKAK